MAEILDVGADGEASVRDAAFSIADVPGISTVHNWGTDRQQRKSDEIRRDAQYIWFSSLF